MATLTPDPVVVAALVEAPVAYRPKKEEFEVSITRTISVELEMT